MLTISKTFLRDVDVKKKKNYLVINLKCHSVYKKIHKSEESLHIKRSLIQNSEIHFAKYATVTTSTAIRC